MTSTFTSSRLGNFREKKMNPNEDVKGDGLKLTMPEQKSNSGYEPTSTFNNTRTSMRMLKGRIDKKQQTEKIQVISNQTINQQTNMKLTINETQNQMKLVLKDSTPIIEKKKIPEVPIKPPEKKKILIVKHQSQDELQPKIKQKVSQIPLNNKQQKQSLSEQIKVQKQNFQKPIHEQDIEQSSHIENQNDLIICPQGCGRKFNRRALQKHAKACKIVFMSKRKEFNSQAKRITSKQQANIVKQTKIKQKKQIGKKNKAGFEKTTDNWKVASEDFRAVLKAHKEVEQEENQEGKEVVMIKCTYCEKPFGQLFMMKHLQSCAQKKIKQKKIKK